MDLGTRTTRPRVDPGGRPPLLGRLNQRGFRLLMVADALVLAVGLVAPMVARHGWDWPSYPPGGYAAGYVAVVLVHLATYYFNGLYEREQRLGSRPILPRVATTTFGAWLVVALAELLTGRYVVPRLNLAVLLVVACLGVTANRRLSAFLRNQREGPPRVVLVGPPDDVNLATQHLRVAEQVARLVGETNTTDGLVARVADTGATDVLLLSARLLDHLYPEPLTTLERQGVNVLQRVTARDTLLGLEGVRELGGMPFVALRSHTLPVSRARFKRALEVTFLVVTAPVVLPVTLALAGCVRLLAGAPVLFFQRRVGREGRVFDMVKFRTMHTDAEEHTGVVLASEQDIRVVPALAWMRATRLDELPQLWHVLRGEMSLVGPRPERPELTAHFERLIPGYARRHEIPPGITGMAQVQGRYHTDPEFKLGHDLQYLVNWSPILDLQILARTVWVVLARRL